MANKEELHKGIVATARHQIINHREKRMLSSLTDCGAKPEKLLS